MKTLHAAREETHLHNYLLLEAINQDHASICSLLISHGAQINVSDDVSITYVR